MKSPFFAFLLLLSFAACSQQPAASYKNADNHTFAAEMKKDNVVILDVRTPEEYAQGHIPNAILMNLHDPDFQNKIDALDKNKEYLVYCAVGGRSGKASAILSDKGFKNVINLQNGFSKWDGPKE